MYQWQGDEGKLLLSLAGERTHALRWSEEHKQKETVRMHFNIVEEWMLVKCEDSRHWLIVRPWASFIPTIEVDGRQHQQWKLRDYFSAQLCKIYQVDLKLLNFKSELSKIAFVYSMYFQGGMRPEHCKSLWPAFTRKCNLKEYKFESSSKYQKSLFPLNHIIVV